MVLIQKSNWVFRATAVVLVVTGMAAVLCISAVQLDLLETPVALTARWTNDYQSLLNREAQSLPEVDANVADAPGGVEYEDSTLLASARKEQDEYMKEKNANGLSQAKDIVKMAKETNAKFGGTFSNGVGSNTWAGTPYAKYDDKDLKGAEFLKSRAESLKVLLNADTHKARMQILALTAARVEADRKAAAEAAKKKARASAKKAFAACNGSAKCEDVLSSVMGIFGHTYGR